MAANKSGKSAKSSPKKPTPKKSASSKGSAAKKNKTRRDELHSQLAKLIGELDEHSLFVMMKQGLVLKHNMQVDEINERLSKTADPGKAKKKKAATVRPGSDKHTIDIVEGENQRHFIIVINNYRNFFSLEEMRKIVKVCQSASNVQDGSARLYNLFQKDRIDVLNNTDIVGPGDPALATIYNAIISRYAVKD